MKSGLCVGGHSGEGSMSSCDTAGHKVRESGERPSSAATRRVGM
jgi:hypothetical protein